MTALWNPQKKTMKKDEGVYIIPRNIWVSHNPLTNEGFWGTPMGGWVYFMNQLWKKRVMLLFWDGWIDFQGVTVVGTGQHTIGRPGQLTHDKQGARWMKIFLVLAQCRFFYEWCLNCMSNDVCLQLCSNSKWMVKKSTPLHPLLHCPILQNVLITLSKRKKQEITSWCLNQPIWKYESKWDHFPK